MHRRLRLLAGFLSALCAGRCLVFAANPQVEVNVVVDMTEAGRKVAPPSKEKPAYYFPVVGGYREEGALVAGEKAPPRNDVIHVLARALASQGYLVIGAKTPPPSLVLVLHWGYMNPQLEDFGSNDPAQRVFFNENEMLALVGGHTLGGLGLDFERESVMQAAEDDRYFVVVAAYDWAAAQQKKKVLLWSAKMSVPSAGTSLTEVIPALAKAGAPQFGRETTRPLQQLVPIGREGKVEVGTPTVVPEKTDAAPPAKK
jgi:hypothetical protein